MPQSRREFMQLAASAFALVTPDRDAPIPFFAEPTPAFQKRLLPTSDEVWDWQVWMAKLGPKYTGNPAHTEFVEFCAKKMQAIGLEVARDRFTLPRWDARRWSLRAGASGSQPVEIPTTGYYPYSGQTTKDGVSGPLLYAGSAAGLARDAKWQVPGADGKIVVADFPVGPTPFAEWWKPWGFYTPETKYPTDNVNGTWAIRVPPLGEIKNQGARAAIFVHTTISDEHARLLYVPFGRALQGLPALWVGREAGARLKSLAERGATATLTLEADIVPNTPTDTLIATLPGQSSDEIIIINTHTDGPNATEENGPLGLLALAQYFSKIPKTSRKRTLVFLMTTGHFAGAYVPSIRGFVEKHPDLVKKAVGALTVEHLGCMEWLDNASMKYAPTGKKELTIAITEFQSTAKVMLDAVQGTADRRVAVVGPTPKGAFNGEGGALSRAGVPTIGYIPIPSYLLAGPQDGCIEKLDKTFLHQQLEALTKVVLKMDGMSSAELRGQGRSTAE